MDIINQPCTYILCKSVDKVIDTAAVGVVNARCIVHRAKLKSVRKGRHVPTGKDLLALLPCLVNKPSTTLPHPAERKNEIKF